MHYVGLGPTLIGFKDLGQITLIREYLEMLVELPCWPFVLTSTKTFVKGLETQFRF